MRAPVSVVSFFMEAVVELFFSRVKKSGVVAMVLVWVGVVFTVRFWPVLMKMGLVVIQGRSSNLLSEAKTSMR